MIHGHQESPCTYIGEQALAYISRKDFQSKWQALYAGCIWATGFQTVDYVLPWYASYRQQYVPLIVAREDSSGELTGLIALAIDEVANQIVGAGAEQSEYQCWLARCDDENSFIMAALLDLTSRFPRYDIYLRYLPASMPLHSLKMWPRLGRLATIQRHGRPIMKLEESAMLAQRRKKNNRQNFNRLSRMGEVSFERLVDTVAFAQIFEDICTQYDFRNGALRGTTPFLTNPAKKRFYLELHKRGILHVTVLRVANTIAASHLGVMDRGSVHLGILTHSPEYASHSPGILHLAMLGLCLSQEGLKEFDLTPGGDLYKTHFATDQDVVFSLTIHSSLWGRWQESMVGMCVYKAKKVAMLCRVNIDSVRAKLGKIREACEMGIVAYAKHAVLENKRNCIYRVTVPANWRFSATWSASENSLEDLLRFRPFRSGYSRKQFLSGAVERLQAGMLAYTHVRENRLVAVCWAGPPSLQLAAEASMELAVPEKTVVLSGFYMDPDFLNAEGLASFIASVVRLLNIEREHDLIYLVGPAGLGIEDVVEEVSQPRTGLKGGAATLVTKLPPLKEQ